MRRNVTRQGTAPCLMAEGLIVERQYGKTNNVKLGTRMPRRCEYAYTDVPEGEVRTCGRPGAIRMLAPEHPVHTVAART